METRRFSTRFASSDKIYKANELFHFAKDMGLAPEYRTGFAPNGRTYRAVIVEDVTDEQFAILSKKTNEINND